MTIFLHGRRPCKICTVHVLYTLYNYGFYSGLCAGLFRLVDETVAAQFSHYKPEPDDNLR